MKEGVSGFKRAKLSTSVSVLTISISLTLLGIFAIVSKNAAALVENIRNKVELEVFLKEPVKGSDIESMRKKTLTIDGVEKAVFISKEDAAKIFKEEFGEDIHKVLDFNPLPPSFKISLKEGFRTAEKAGEIQKEILQIKGVDDVIYRKALLEFIDRRAKMFSLLTLGLGFLITLSAVFLVSNTIRLAIYSKRQIIQTMKLVGATHGFVRMPFLLEGIIQGFLGGLIASVVVYLLIKVVLAEFTAELTDILSTDFTLYVILVLIGIVLGLLGSVLSVRKFITESVAT